MQGNAYNNSSKKFKWEVGTAGNWFIKRLLGSLDRELVTESAEARQEDAFFLQHTVQTTTCIIYGRGVGENPQIKEKDDESINGEVLKTTFARIVASGTLIELETFTLWQKARFC
ncbi:uncharacterized protein [Montipora capricornis]|uniref:uncharacterized protein n=1 Tax=Montipora foliosa TaxID=591990 RepID=UPI0035F144C4